MRVRARGDLSDLINWILVVFELTCTESWMSVHCHSSVLAAGRFFTANKNTKSTKKNFRVQIKEQQKLYIVWCVPWQMEQWFQSSTACKPEVSVYSSKIWINNCLSQFKFVLFLIYMTMVTISDEIRLKASTRIQPYTQWVNPRLVRQQCMYRLTATYIRLRWPWSCCFIDSIFYCLQDYKKLKLSESNIVASVFPQSIDFIRDNSKPCSVGGNFLSVKKISSRWQTVQTALCTKTQLH